MRDACRCKRPRIHKTYQRLSLCTYALVAAGSAANKRSWKVSTDAGLRASRRQRGFESRWGYKIKPTLTRPDTTISQRASPWLYRHGRAREQELPPVLAFTLQISRLRLPKTRGSSAGGVVLSRGWTSSGTQRPWHPATRASTIKRHYRPKGYPTCRRPPSTCDPP
jgi:hypothetical protein